MESITLVRGKDPSTDPWLVAVSRDYEIPENAHVFAAGGLQDEERVAFWIGKDGGGFGCIDNQHDLYVKASEAAINGDFTLMSEHGGVDEYEFDAGTFKYNAKTITTKAKLSFFGE